MVPPSYSILYCGIFGVVVSLGAYNDDKQIDWANANLVSAIVVFLAGVYESYTGARPHSADFRSILLGLAALFSTIGFGIALARIVFAPINQYFLYQLPNHPGVFVWPLLAIPIFGLSLLRSRRQLKRLAAMRTNTRP